MKILQNLFSIKKDNRYHKIITICGLKFKIVNNKKKTIYKLKSEFDIKLKEIEDLSMRRIRKITPYNFIDTIEIHIVEHCNLNCKGCVHFSPLAKEEYLDIDEFKKDLNRLKELTNGNIKIFNILGGEPLLNPRCTEYLEIARNLFPNSIVKLVTNGLLLPEQSNSFYELCAKKNITIEPTKYQIGIDWEFIENKCKEYGVKLEYFQSSGFTVKTLYKEVLNVNGDSNTKEQFLNCRLDDKSWMFLDHGKIYKCARNAYIRHFINYFNVNLEVSNDDYIDIYKVDSVKEILEFFAKPSSFCRYCAKEKNTFNHPWSKSERKITEWVEIDEDIDKNNGQTNDRKDKKTQHIKNIL